MFKKTLLFLFLFISFFETQAGDEYTLENKGVKKFLNSAIINNLCPRNHKEKLQKNEELFLTALSENSPHNASIFQELCRAGAVKKTLNDLAKADYVSELLKGFGINVENSALHNAHALRIFLLLGKLTQWTQRPLYQTYYEYMNAGAIFPLIPAEEGTESAVALMKENIELYVNKIRVPKNKDEKIRNARKEVFYDVDQTVHALPVALDNNRNNRNLVLENVKFLTEQKIKNCSGNTEETHTKKLLRRNQNLLKHLENINAGQNVKTDLFCEETKELKNYQNAMELVLNNASLDTKIEEKKLWEVLCDLEKAQRRISGKNHKRFFIRKILGPLEGAENGFISENFFSKISEETPGQLDLTSLAKTLYLFSEGFEVQERHKTFINLFYKQFQRIEKGYKLRDVLEKKGDGCDAFLLLAAEWQDFFTKHEEGFRTDIYLFGALRRIYALFSDTFGDNWNNPNSEASGGILFTVLLLKDRMWQQENLN